MFVNIYIQRKIKLMAILPVLKVFFLTMPAAPYSLGSMSGLRPGHPFPQSL